MTTRRVGFVLRVLLLAAALADARSAHGADASEGADGDRVVWGLDAAERPWSAWVAAAPGGARLVAVRPGIVVPARGALWRWQTVEMPAPARLSCERDGAMNGHGTGVAVRASLQRLGAGSRAGRQIVVRPPFAAARQTAEYAHHVELEGSVGSLLFVTDQAYDYTCGVHGGVGFGFRVWDAERADSIDLAAAISSAERASLLQQARESLAADPDLGSGPDVLPAANDVHASRLAPVYEPDGRLRLAHWFWMDTCYACGDGEWSSYTRSARVVGDELPPSVRGRAATLEGLGGLALPGEIHGVSAVGSRLRATFEALARE